ncbi:MAG TPA: hypothetical protein PKD90_17440, partial [Phnomibacter sp.]|nr:hypothetical protein [Phnomibacter sp.]
MPTVSQITATTISTLAMFVLLNAQGQSTAERIKQNARWKAENKTQEKVDDAIDKLLDGKLFKKKDKNKTQDAEEEPANNKRITRGSATTYDPYNVSTDNAGNTDYSAYKNFDFVPAENILFFEDFADGLIQWNVNEWDVWEDVPKAAVVKLKDYPNPWYYMPRKGHSQHKSAVALPEHFTLEYDIYADADNMNEHEGGLLNIFVKRNGLNLDEFSYHFDQTPQLQIDIHPSLSTLYISAHREYGYERGIDNTRIIFEALKKEFWHVNKIHRVSIWRNGTHVKVYINQDKVMDLPNALPAGETYTMLMSNNTNGHGILVSNIPLAGGAPQPAAAIKDKNTFTTQNIYFNTN